MGANFREMLEVAVRINFRGSKIRGAANDARHKRSQTRARIIIHNYYEL